MAGEASPPHLIYLDGISKDPYGRGGVSLMQEINDQYPEYAPPVERLKARKHRRGGINALPLCACALFISGIFVHPYFNASGQNKEPVAVVSESLPEVSEGMPSEQDTGGIENMLQPESLTEPEMQTVLETEETTEEGTSAEETSPVYEEETEGETKNVTESRSDPVPETRAPAPRETLPAQTSAPPQETAAPLPSEGESAVQESTVETSAGENIQETGSGAAEESGPWESSAEPVLESAAGEWQEESASDLYFDPTGLDTIESQPMEQESDWGMTDIDNTGEDLAPAVTEDTAGDSAGETSSDTASPYAPAMASADFVESDPEPVGTVIPDSADYETEPVVWEDIP